MDPRSRSALSLSGAGGPRKSCQNCTRKRCKCAFGTLTASGSTRLPCERCELRGIECVYEVSKRPGKQPAHQRKAETNDELALEEDDDVPSEDRNTGTARKPGTAGATRVARRHRRKSSASPAVSTPTTTMTGQPSTPSTSSAVDGDSSNSNRACDWNSEAARATAGLFYTFPPLSTANAGTGSLALSSGNVSSLTAVNYRPVDLGIQVRAEDFRCPTYPAVSSLSLGPLSSAHQHQLGTAPSLAYTLVPPAPALQIVASLAQATSARSSSSLGLDRHLHSNILLNSNYSPRPSDGIGTPSTTTTDTAGSVSHARTNGSQNDSSDSTRSSSSGGACSTTSSRTFQQPHPLDSLLITGFSDVQVPEQTVNQLIWQFWEHFYQTTPIIVRREAIRNSARLPAFVRDVFCFSTCYFLEHHAGQKSVVNNNTALVPRFHARICKTLPAAVEKCLSGQDILMLGDSTTVVYKEGSRELGLFVVFSLVSIGVVCLAEKSTSSDYLRDALLVLRLAVRVARTIGMNREWLFRDPSKQLITDEPSPLIELCRRVWWILFSVDRQISVTFDRAPLTTLEECEVGFPLPDMDYETKMEGFAERPRSGIFDTTPPGPVVLASTPPSCFKKPEYLMLKPPAACSLAVDPRSSRPPPPFQPYEYYVALLNLYERTRHLRQLCTQPNNREPCWADRHFRPGILADLDAWFCGLPKMVQMMDDEVLAKGGRLDNVGKLASVNGIAHRLIMFHTLYVLLCSPLDLLHASQEPGWVESPAFVKAQEHALRTTFWLKQILESGRGAPDMAGGFFQFCVVRTGLIHLSFFRALTSHPSLLRKQAIEHVNLHTRALIAGQRGPEWQKGGQVEWTEEGVGEGNKGRRGTYWYRVWLKALAS